MTKKNRTLFRRRTPTPKEIPARARPAYTSRVYAWLPPAPTSPEDPNAARGYHERVLELLQDGPPFECCPTCEGTKVEVLATTPEFVSVACRTCDGRGTHGPAPLTHQERALLGKLARRWSNRAAGLDRRWAIYGAKRGRLPKEEEEALRPPPAKEWTMDDPTDGIPPRRRVPAKPPPEPEPENYPIKFTLFKPGGFTPATITRPRRIAAVAHALQERHGLEFEVHLEPENVVRLQITHDDGTRRIVLAVERCTNDLDDVARHVDQLIRTAAGALHLEIDR